MKEVYLSILVVNCKDYKPSHNWYLRKSDSCFYGAAKESDKFWHDELKLKEYEASDDFVLMPECPNMTDEEAAEVVKKWCEENDIPYIDDMEIIEEAYKWYYKYGEYEDPRVAFPGEMYHLAGL